MHRVQIDYKNNNNLEIIPQNKIRVPIEYDNTGGSVIFRKHQKNIMDLENFLKN